MKAKITFRGERGYYEVLRNGEHVATITGGGGCAYVNGAGEGAPFLARCKYKGTTAAKKICRAVLGAITVEVWAKSVNPAEAGHVSPADLEKVFGKPERCGKRGCPETTRWLNEIHTAIEYVEGEGRYANAVTTYPSWKPEGMMSHAERAPIVAARIAAAGPGEFVKIPFGLTYGAGAEALAAARAAL